MAVVINEFEVVPAPVSSVGSSSGGDAASQSSQSPQQTAHELEKIFRRQQERQTRIRAY